MLEGRQICFTWPDKIIRCDCASLEFSRPARSKRIAEARYTNQSLQIGLSILMSGNCGDFVSGDIKQFVGKMSAKYRGLLGIY